VGDKKLMERFGQRHGTKENEKVPKMERTTDE
jgi:hypothetical protein